MCRAHIIFHAVFLILVCRLNPNVYLCNAKHCNQLGETHKVRSVRGYCLYYKGAYPRVMSVMDLQPS